MIRDAGGTPTAISEPALMLIADLAREVGAEAIARDASVLVRMLDDEQLDARRLSAWCATLERHLILHLQHHIAEHHRALVGSEEAAAERVRGFELARALVDLALDRWDAQAHREQVEAWLGLERTKFLMGTKADALATLFERLAALRLRRYEERRVGAELATQVAEEAVASLHERLEPGLGKLIAAYSRDLVRALHASIGELPEPVPPLALAGFDLPPLRRPGRYVRPVSLPGVASQLADRLHLVGRRGIDVALRDALFEALGIGSQRAVRALLDDYDVARAAIQRRLCELLDRVIETARAAASHARVARAGGPESVARARAQVIRWNALLADLIIRLG